MNVSGDISNTGGNVVDQEDYGFRGSFVKIPPIVIYDITKKKSMKMKRTPMLNNDDQQLNHPICENIDEKENDKEDNLTYEEDRTQQARRDEKKTKDKYII